MKFQDKYLNYLDQILGQRVSMDGQSHLQGRDSANKKVVELFENVLQSIKNLNFVQSNPNGNV